MIKKTFKTFTKFTAYCAASFFFALGLWINRRFGDPSFEQVIYHLQFGGEGLVDADKSLIRDFLIYCLLVSLILAILLYNIEVIVLKIRMAGFKVYLYETYKKLYLITFRLFLRVERLVYFLFKKQLPLILLILGAAFLLTKVSFWNYLTNLKYENYVDQHYVAPKNVKPPENKRNLIFIYVESLENTYRNTNIFDRDLLKSLDQATSNWESFSNFKQASGTGWTIAGIVSSQCGIPLRPYSWFDHDEPEGRIDENKLGEKVDYFLPGIRCLGDILNDAGYKNVFMGGASTAFAGKGKFLLHHGYHEIYGREEWRALGEKNFNGWGLFDDRLLYQAKVKLDQLAKDKNQPFNLTLLTLDTHPPGGHISPYCNQSGVLDLLGVIECTSDMTAEFIQYIKAKGYDKNTDIVLMGDHISMMNNYSDLILKEPNRTVYNKFYSSRALVKNRDTIYHFSVFPTVLYMLGFDFARSRAGLGASGFGPLDPNYNLHLEKDLDNKLNAKSEIYKTFWGVTN